MSSDSNTSSLKVFMLYALAWLPISFFFWFQWAGVLVAPVGWGAEAALQLWLGEQFRELTQSGYLLVIDIYFVPPDGTRMQLNPMIYGYGLPLFAGLAIAAPNAIWKRFVHILLGWLCISLVQIWGIVWEAFKQLGFSTGEEGLAVVSAVGLSRELIVLAYQFGYLIFPAVAPIVLWIFLNRRFLEGLVAQRLGGKAGETPSIDRGQLD